MARYGSICFGDAILYFGDFTTSFQGLLCIVDVPIVLISPAVSTTCSISEHVSFVVN